MAQAISGKTYPPSGSPSQAESVADTSRQDLLRERRALAGEFREIVRSTAELPPAERAAAIRAWREQHAAAFAALPVRERQASGEGAALSPERLTALKARRAPAGLEGEDLVLWQKRQELQISRLELMEASKGKTPEERKLLHDNWKQANESLAGEVAAMQRAAAERDTAKPLPPVPALTIPEGASVEEAAKLTALHDLRVLQRERAELMRSLRAATPEQRQAALKGWQQSKGPELQRQREAMGRSLNQLVRPTRSATTVEATNDE